VIPRANPLFCYNDVNVVLPALFFHSTTDIYVWREKLGTILYDVEHVTSKEMRTMIPKRRLDEEGWTHRYHRDHNCDGNNKTQTRRKQATVRLIDDVQSMLVNW